MTEAINEAQEQRNQVRQAQQGIDPSYGSSSDDFAQPAKSTNANGASGPLDAAADVSGSETGGQQEQQAGYGSNPQQDLANDDPNNRSAIGGTGGQQSGQDQFDDDEDVDSTSGHDDRR